MITSRPLVTDRIVDFPVADRFLKLPIQGFLDVEGVVPLPPQTAIINAINDPRFRQIVGCLSRRTGKTYVANRIAFLKVMEPKCNALIVSPNYSLSNISWKEQETLLNNHGIEVVSKNKTDREIHLHNGSMIKIGSVSQADSLVGRSYDLIMFDEAALDSKGRDVYNVQLRPTLDKPNSKVIFISTPRGSNYFKEFYERGFDSAFPTWVSIHSTYLDNPRMTEEDVAEARNSMSRAEFRQEYLAEFTTFEGQIYGDFDPDVHVVETDWDLIREEPGRYDRLLGIDPGYKDPTAGLVIYYDNELDHFHCVWDYQVPGLTTAAHCSVFVEQYNAHDIDMVFVDAANAQFREDAVTMYDLPSNPAKKSVLDGITYVQHLIEQGKLTVDPSCVFVIEMLLNYRWDPNENLTKPRPVHDIYSHIADALRYALYSLLR